MQYISHKSQNSFILQGYDQAGIYLLFNPGRSEEIPENMIGSKKLDDCQMSEWNILRSCSV